VITHNDKPRAVRCVRSAEVKPGVGTTKGTLFCQLRMYLMDLRQATGVFFTLSQRENIKNLPDFIHVLGPNSWVDFLAVFDG